MKKFMKILAVILAVPVSLFVAICCWCIYDVFLTDNWENYTKTEEYQMKQEQRRLEEEKERLEQEQKEQPKQEKKEEVKEQPKQEKKEEKKVEVNEENSVTARVKEIGRESINGETLKNPAVYMDEDYFRDCIFTVVYNRENFYSDKPYFGLSKEEGRRLLIEGMMEKMNIVLDDSVDELFEMCTIMIDNKFTTIEEYNEFIKTPEEKQADKNLIEEMKEFTAEIAKIEASKYEPVEEWKKESTGRNYRNSLHLILHNSLINEFPEASEEQRMEAINHGKEVFVQNYPTIQE